METQVNAVQVSAECFLEAVRQDTEQMLRDVMHAVNQAPDGAWINGSEKQVRDLIGDFRQRVYEKALQMRCDTTKGAFSPDGPGNQQAAEKQGR